LFFQDRDRRDQVGVGNVLRPKIIGVRHGSPSELQFQRHRQMVRQRVFVGLAVAQ
jgi:hypothetical protein